MKILTFDTCLNKMYIALKNGEQKIVSKIVETTQTNYHSAFLISTIRDILHENNLLPSDIDAVATNIGPGSFTGIRACVTVARVFAQANNIKAVGVSSLEILARVSNSEKVLVALDARKEMAYVAAFENGTAVLMPQAMPLGDVNALIAQGNYDLIVDDKMHDILGGSSYQSLDKDLGEILLTLAEEKLLCDEDFDWKKLHPLYIQPPPVVCKK